MSVKWKLVLGMVGIALLASGATSGFFYYQAKKALLHAVEQELRSVAMIGAQLVSGDKLAKLQRPQQMQSKDYKDIQNLMGKIAQTNDEFLYAYTLRNNKGQVSFIVDSPPSDDNGNGKIDENELPADLGEVYDDVPQSLLQGFVEPAVDQEPWEDEWGWTISGYAPIFDSHGQGVGLLGIDMSLSRMEAKLAGIRYGALLSIALAFIVALLASWYFVRLMTKPLKKLQTGIKELAAGNYAVRVNYTRKDELGQVIDYFNQMAEELREKEILKSCLGKIVNKDVAQCLLADRPRLGGEVVEATILFCDLRGFSRLTAKLPPTLLVNLLNEYFTAMVKIVEDHGGIVDKFIGDSVMAVFGHPTHKEHAEQGAVAAGVEMLKACQRINAKLQLEGELRLCNSVGIHRGYVVAGTIGSPERMEYTFIGDAVNVAARLEAKTREWHSRLAASSLVCQELSPCPKDLKFIGDLELMDQGEKLGVYVLEGTKRPVDKIEEAANYDQ